MKKSLCFFLSLLVFFSGLKAVDGIIQIPNTRVPKEVAGPNYLLQTRGKAFTVDSELRIHLIETPLDPAAVDASAWMFHSFDLGKTWFQDYTTPAQCTWLDLTADEEGNLYLVWLDTLVGVMLIKSPDGGEHWSAPQTLTLQPPLKDSLLPVFPTYPTVRCSSNKVYVAWISSRYRRCDRMTSPDIRKIYLIISDNKGSSWNPPQVIIEDTFPMHALAMASIGSRVSLIWTESSMMNEFLFSSDRLCYSNSSDYGQTWTENRSPTGKAFIYDNDLYYNGYHATDLELGRKSDYVVWDSANTMFVASTSDRGWHWRNVVKITAETDDKNVATELSLRDSVLAVLTCMDNRVWLEYSTDWGATFTDPVLLSQAPGTSYGAATGDPRLSIDKYYRIHALWSQSLDSAVSAKALFYYMRPTSGVAEPPVECEGGPLVLVSPNPFTDRVCLEMACGETGPFDLSVYDASGSAVKEFRSVGKGSPLYWDGSDGQGRRLPAGLYFIHARSPDGTELHKVIKLK